MKILLVEDDRIIWENIKDYLTENTFIVTWLQSWEHVVHEIEKNHYDLCILDVMLPMKDGFQIAREIRTLNMDTSFIFLTAKEDLESIEKWFSLWGDDYITKPFKLKELILRIRSILRRINKTQSIDSLSAGNIILELSIMEVRRGDKVITLTPKEFQILEYLMRNKNKVVPKHELLEYIWGIHNDIRSDVIRTHIQSLRTKLNQWFSFDPIKTIRGIGFKFENYED